MHIFSLTLGRLGLLVERWPEGGGMVLSRELPGEVLIDFGRWRVVLARS